MQAGGRRFDPDQLHQSLGRTPELKWWARAIGDHAIHAAEKTLAARSAVEAIGAAIASSVDLRDRTFVDN